MIFWIIAAVGSALIILTGRTWLEFVQRSDQLNPRITELEGLLEAHNQRLVEVRERAEAINAQIDRFARRGVQRDGTFPAAAGG
jgi:hypothetical protein